MFDSLLITDMNGAEITHFYAGAKCNALNAHNPPKQSTRLGPEVG